MLPPGCLLIIGLAFLAPINALPNLQHPRDTLHYGGGGGGGEDPVTFTLAAATISPDGFSRTASLVNGQYPGPVLTATKGQSLSVNVINKLNDPTMRQSTSIHWHGLFQSQNSQNDGPSFVTQCPIAPNNSYLYNIALGDQAGTFWYHSHLDTQYVDGIRGAIVIYDPEDPFRHMYDVDDLSTVITFGDWYHAKAEALVASFLNNGNEPVADSGLINGIGRSGGGPNVTLARVNVVRGLRYRFRLVCISTDAFFNFAIQGHRLTVIEVDGINHKPLVVDAINMAPGQRYSVVVHANQTIGNYWIQGTATVIGGQITFPFNPNFNGNLSLAVLHYAFASHNEPPGPPLLSLPPGGVQLEEFQLVPLEPSNVPKEENPPDLQVFNFDFNIGASNGDVWTVNNVQYQSPKVPTLLNVLANGFTNASQFGPNENTIVLPPNITVEISFLGTFPVGPGHAFHLHGHAFDVVQSVSGPPNYINPPRRDVVISGNNAVRVRFRTDNPGPWFVHCHIDWHLRLGLAVVFVEDPTGIPSGSLASHPDPAWEQLCSIYNALPPSEQ